MEKKEFEIGLLINDKGKKIRFHTKKKWEVEWNNERIGIVFPKELQFERDGKKYQVLVDVSLQKKWFFKYGVMFWHFELSPNVDYQIYYSDEPKPEPKPGERSKNMDNYVRLVNEWRVGNIVLLISSILVVIVVTFIIWKKLKNAKNKKN